MGFYSIYLNYNKANRQNLILYLDAVICFEGVEEKSSHYGLYMLGFTCATRVKTMRNNSKN